MAVLARMTAPGMTQEIYDESAEKLTAPLLAAQGFVAHSAFAREGEFRVSEIWENRDDFENWFENNVKPNVRGVEVESVIDIHNVVVKK